MLDSVNAAVLLCQLLYWSDKGAHPDGWIYKTQIEIEEETGLTRRKQESARHALVECGILEEMRMGSHGTLHFKINTRQLDSLWSAWLDKTANGGNRQWRKPPNANGGNRQTLNKDTEITTETTHQPPPRARFTHPVHAAIEVYRDVFGTDPPVHGQSLIERDVSNLDVWREVCEQWKGNNNITGKTWNMIDAYRNRLKKDEENRAGGGKQRYGDKPAITRDFSKYPTSTG